MTDKDAHSPGDSLRGHLFCQPGLTDARLASDRSQPTAAGNGAVDKPTQKVTFRLSAYKGGALPGLVLHDLSIIPPAVTDRLRATRNDAQDEPTHSHVAAAWHIPAQSPVAPGPPTMPVRPWPGPTARGARAVGQWAPPHHPIS